MIGGLQEFAMGIGEEVTTFVTEKPLITAGLGVAAIGVGTAGVIVASKIRSGAKKSSTKKRSKKGHKRDHRFRSKQKHELAYVKRKRKAGKKITRPAYKSKGSGKQKRFVKGSKEAKRYMAKLRGMKGR